jgi:hypothetical protein
MSSAQAPSYFALDNVNIRSVSWSELARQECLHLGIAHGGNDIEAVRSAFSHVKGTEKLSGLINSIVLDGFASEPDSTADWARSVVLPNFVASQIGMLKEPARLTPHAKGSSADMVSFGYASQNWRLARYSGQVVLDEEDLINSGPIELASQAFAEMGRAARRLVLDAVYAFLLDNPELDDGEDLFDAARQNLVTDALARGSLDTAIGRIASVVRRDAENTPQHLNWTPRYLVCAPGVQPEARRLVKEMSVASDIIQVRSESRLSLTGTWHPAKQELQPGTDTGWLLATPATQAAGLVIGSLNGRVEPSVRVQPLREGRWGLMIAVVLDVGVTSLDPESLHYSDGSTPAPEPNGD